jgi:hypothetical protein
VLEILIVVAVCVAVMGVAARLALPALRQYRGVQNDKRTAQLERELHMGDYASLAPPTSFPDQQPRPAPDPRPQWVLQSHISTASASASSTPPKPKVLHIEDIPDVPEAPKPAKKSLYQQWVDDQ